jgi:hypothetical protein
MAQEILFHRLRWLFALCRFALWSESGERNEASGAF